MIGRRKGNYEDRGRYGKRWLRPLKLKVFEKPFLENHKFYNQTPYAVPPLSPSVTKHTLVFKSLFVLFNRKREWLVRYVTPS